MLGGEEGRRRAREWLRRTAEAVWPVFQQAVAAGTAWLIAVAVLRREEPLEAPFFAPIAAVVALNATLGRRGSNALRLLLGVIVGIVVGELALAIAGGGVWTLTVSSFVAMLVAQLLDGARVVTAQAAVSAILITAFGDPAQGANRLFEALIGGAVALLFSQLLFSPDPLRLLRRAETGVLTVLADGLRLTAEALEHDQPELAEQALTRLRGLRDRLSDLATMRKASRRVVRHSVTWRSKEVPVVHERERTEHLDLLAGSCVLLTRTAPTTSTSQRAALAPGVRQLADEIGRLAVEPGNRSTRQRAAEWALELGRWGAEYVTRDDSPAMVATCAAVRMISLDVMVFAGVQPEEAREALDARVEQLRIAETPKPSRWRWVSKLAGLRRPRLRLPRPRWPRPRLRRLRRDVRDDQEDSSAPGGGGGPEDPAG